MKSVAAIHRADKTFRIVTLIVSWSVVLLIALILLQVGGRSLPAMKEFGIGFLWTNEWDPVNEKFGALALIYGTLVSAALALLIATPLGVGIAIFLSEDYLPRSVREVFRFLVELLAAIPSVIYGLWGIVVIIPLTTTWGLWLWEKFQWIPLFSTPPYGPGMLPAALVLAIMVLPTIAALSRSALAVVPPQMKAGAEALGATRWEVLLKISLPNALTGIFGAVVLALGRAMGETMALAMLVGNNNQISPSILAPANTIASLLANSFGEASGMQIAALMYLSFILLLLTLVVNFVAENIIARSNPTKRS